MKRTILVVPCYNEADRLDTGRFEACLERAPGVDFLFVNDGSRDATLDVLNGFAKRHPERIAVRDLQPNGGKAAAVRQGMLDAFERAPDFVGYWDADLATPLEEFPRFLAVLESMPDRQIVIGSRVKLLGRSIERGALRHYLGRVAATVASMTLQLGVYDTQCGAKLFRATPSMRALFDEPFSTGWVFDVEIIARLIRDLRQKGDADAEELIYELPLDQWHDVAGSNIKASDFLKAFLEMGRIHRRYLGRAAGRAGARASR